MFMMQLKRNLELHILNDKNKMHTIYVFNE